MLFSLTSTWRRRTEQLVSRWDRPVQENTRDYGEFVRAIHSRLLGDSRTPNIRDCGDSRAPNSCDYRDLCGQTFAITGIHVRQTLRLLRLPGLVPTTTAYENSSIGCDRRTEFYLPATYARIVVASISHHPSILCCAECDIITTRITALFSKTFRL